MSATDLVEAMNEVDTYVHRLRGLAFEVRTFCVVPVWLQEFGYLHTESNNLCLVNTATQQYIPFQGFPGYYDELLSAVGLHCLVLAKQLFSKLLVSLLVAFYLFLVY